MTDATTPPGASAPLEPLWDVKKFVKRWMEIFKEMGRDSKGTHDHLIGHAYDAVAKEAFAEYEAALAEARERIAELEAQLEDARAENNNLTGDLWTMEQTIKELREQR